MTWIFMTRLTVVLLTFHMCPSCPRLTAGVYKAKKCYMSYMYPILASYDRVFNSN